MGEPIQTRVYYAIDVELVSPLSVSSGKNEITDADVLVNGAGEFFVPGTSLAGVMRNYLETAKNEESVFGYSKGQKGKMSSLFISDLYFTAQGEEQPVAISSIRDNVELTDEKTVNEKFDREIVESGARGILYINYLVRQGESEQDYENIIHTILRAFESGEIRIGSKKNRGFGRIKIKNIYIRKFAYSNSGSERKSFNLESWIDFKKDFKNLNNYEKREDFKNWLDEFEPEVRKYIALKVPLKLTGGISIRRYFANTKKNTEKKQKTKVDFEQICREQDAVIPGSSWNGAIRADIKAIFRELGVEEQHQQTLMHDWFGMVDKKHKTAKQSCIVIGESVIKGGEKLPITRNRINRLDASTKDKALYSEIAYFGGKTALEILVRKDEERSYKALLGMITLVIQDIQDGYLAIGGQTGIGRGIFAADKEKTIECSEEETFEECRKVWRQELYNLLKS